MADRPFASGSSYPVRTTSSLDFFVDGEHSFEAIAAAISAAQGYVYITCAYGSVAFKPCPPAGPSLLDLCAQACERGVTVAVLIWLPDGTVSDTIPLTQADEFARRRIAARWDKAKCRGVYAVVPQLACHHQKTFVIDGQKAFVGGINMVQSYWDTRAHASVDERRVGYEVTDAGLRARTAADMKLLPLHDAFSAFTGPAVADVEANFVERWNGASLRDATTRDLMASLAGSDPGAATRIQIVRTIAPDTYPHTASGEESVKEAMLALIASATQSIYFENQYFFDGDVVEAIRAAANRGVRVVGLLCRSPDAGTTVGVLEDFLDAGSESRLRWAVLDPAMQKCVQLYSPVTTDLPTKDIYVHAKLMIADDRYALLGSANIAFTSLEFHSEMCALVDDAGKVLALRRSLFAEHLCVPEDEVPPGFADGAGMWAAHAVGNLARLKGRAAPNSRVIPLSPVSAWNEDAG